MDLVTRTGDPGMAGQSGEDPQAVVTGRHFYHQQHRAPHPAANDPTVQDQLLTYCATLTGVTL